MAEGELSGTPPPKGPPLSAEETLMNQVSDILIQQERPASTPDPEPAETDDAAEEQVVEETQAETEDHDGEAGSEAEESAEDADAPESAEEEGIELPNTLSGLAEALEIPLDELSSHIKGVAKINGEEVEVTLNEALRGYQRTQDYELKTARLARERDALQTQQTEFEQAKQDRLTQLDTHIKMLAEAAGAGPTDEELLRINYEQGSAAAEEARIKRDILNRKLTEATQVRDREIQENQQQQQQRFAEWRIAQQDKARELMPELAKSDSLAAFETGVRATLADYGYNDQEVAGFFSGYDARQLQILRDAMEYRKLKDAKPNAKKLLAKLPKPKKPGQATPRGKKSEMARSAAFNRLKSSRGKGKQANEAAAKEYFAGLLD